MPCIVEKNDCSHEPMWYCCNCGDGPLNCGVVKKCLDVVCGHEYTNCDRQDPLVLEPRNKHSISFGKKHSRRKNHIDLPFRTSDSDTRKLDIQIPKQSEFELRPSGKQGCDTIADEHAGEAASSLTKLYDSPSASTTPQSTGSTFSSCMTTPFSDSSSIDLHSIIDMRVEYLIERILGVLYILYNTKSRNFVCTTNGETPSTSSSSKVSLGSLEVPTSKNKQFNHRSPLKRDRDDGEDDGGEDGGRSRKQPKTMLEPETQQYACVFLKRHPTKYMHWPSCGSVGWRNVARLKEHLYRRHRVFLCWRCSRTFRKENDLQKHAREENNCVLDESCLNSAEEGIDPDTERRLRNRRGQSSLNEIEKWKKMYVIVFGVSLDECPSPYFDPSEFKEGRFRGSAVDHERQRADHYRRDIRRRLLGPLSDILRRHLTHVARTDVYHRSNSVDSLVLPITEDLIILLTQLASTTSPLSCSSDAQSERSGVDSISSTITAAPETSQQYSENIAGTGLSIGNIDLRSSLEGSWAVTTRDVTVSPFPAVTYPPEFSLQSDSYENRSYPALGEHLDDMLTLECPATEMLEPTFQPQEVPQSYSFSEYTKTDAEALAKSQFSAPPISAADSNKSIREQAATKGIESIGDEVFDPGNLITGLSSSIDTFPDFETFDTEFGEFG